MSTLTGKPHSAEKPHLSSKTENECNNNVQLSKLHTNYEIENFERESPLLHFSRMFLQLTFSQKKLKSFIT